MGTFISKTLNKEKKTAVMAEEKTPVAMTHFAQAQTTFKPPLIANENAFLGDISTR
jgi:hypothetical protein